MSSGRRRLLAGLLFCGPWILGLSVFLAYPVIAALYYSCCSYSVLLPAVFIGADNYVELASDRLFWQSLWNTSFFAAMSVGLGLAVSLGMALLLNCRVRGQAFYRTVFFLPTLMPVVASSMLWLWMLGGDAGIINHGLAQLGIDGPNWLRNAVFIKWSLILMSVWGAGHAMVIILAGLQEVPGSLYEAAVLDGATWWGRLWHITVPSISPVLYFNLVMGLIGGFQVFTQAYIMLGPTGGEGRAGLFYVLHLYNLAFEDLRMGYASAMAVVLFVIILSLTLIVHRCSRRFVHYAD